METAASARAKSSVSTRGCSGLGRGMRRLLSPVPAAKHSTRDAHLPEGHRDPRDHHPPGEGLFPQCLFANPTARVGGWRRFEAAVKGNRSRAGPVAEPKLTEGLLRYLGQWLRFRARNNECKENETLGYGGSFPHCLRIIFL